jgi:hypothetical protein
MTQCLLLAQSELAELHRTCPLKADIGIIMANDRVGAASLDLEDG